MNTPILLSGISGIYYRKLQVAGGAGLPTLPTLSSLYIKKPQCKDHSIQESKAMKNFALLSIVGLAFLQPVVEAIFLGPIAVGAVLGAIAVGKGLLLGSLLSQRRSRKQSYR